MYDLMPNMDWAMCMIAICIVKGSSDTVFAIWYEDNGTVGTLSPIRVSNIVNGTAGSFYQMSAISIVNETISMILTI